MRLMIDTANLKDIEEINNNFPLEGVTTNPTLIAREGKAPLELLREIRRIVGPQIMLHAQVLGETSGEMVHEGIRLSEAFEGKVYVKIPTTIEGIKAIKDLKAIGALVTATTIFTPLQAYMAAKAGADFVAPYVNRLASITTDGINVISEIVESFRLHNISTQVLAASFMNVAQVQQVYLAGAHSVTVNPSVFRELINHPLTDSSITKFQQDWLEQYGERKMLHQW